MVLLVDHLVCSFVGADHASCAARLACKRTTRLANPKQTDLQIQNNLECGCGAVRSVSTWRPYVGHFTLTRGGWLLVTICTTFLRFWVSVCLMSVCTDLPISVEQLCPCFLDAFMRLAVNSSESQRHVLVCRLWFGDNIVQQSSRVLVCCYCRGCLAVGFSHWYFFSMHIKRFFNDRTAFATFATCQGQQLGDLSTNRTAKAAFTQSIHPAFQQPWHERRNVGEHLLWQCPYAR